MLEQDEHPLGNGVPVPEEEERQDDLVEAHDEREDPRRQPGRPEVGKQYLAEHEEPGRPQAVGDLLDADVGRADRHRHEQHDVGHAQNGVTHDQPRVRSQERKLGKDDIEGHRLHDRRHDQRRHEVPLDQRLAAEAPADQPIGRQAPEHERGHAGGEGDDHRVPRRVQPRRVAEERAVPAGEGEDRHRRRHADVDADHAAVHAAGKIARVLAAARENGCAVAVATAVGPFNRFVERLRA